MPNRSWPEPYADLAAAITALRAACPHSALLGASIAHPRHSVPPEHLRLLSEIHANTPIVVPGTLQIFKKAAICFASAIVDAAVYVALRARFAVNFCPDRRVDIVLKTWVPGETALAKPADFYFGSLADQLAVRGKTAVFLAGDGRSDDGRLFSKLRSLSAMFGFARAAQATNGRYFPETLLVPPLAPIRAVLSQVKTTFQVRALAVASKDEIFKRVAAAATLDVLRPYTTKNLMHAHSARAAVEHWKSSAIATFYEGQPWEKVFWGAVKQVDPSIKLLGYQHTVVMPHSFALTRPVAIAGDVTAPDVVLCSGGFTRQLLEEAHAELGTKFVTLGSYRRAAGASTPVPPRPSAKTVLVLPEGILTEAILLFNGAMELAQSLPDHQFVFRCHPVLPFEKVAPHLKLQLTDCPNVSLSVDPQIQNDFLRCSVLLYRGSSAVLYGVLAGLKPFCWLDPTAPNVDPLSAVEGWRETVDSIAAIRSKLLDYARLPASEAEREWRGAAAQVDQMAQPVTTENVAEFEKHFCTIPSLFEQPIAPTK